MEFSGMRTIILGLLLFCSNAFAVDVNVIKEQHCLQHTRLDDLAILAGAKVSIDETIQFLTITEMNHQGGTVSVRIICNFGFDD